MCVVLGIWVNLDDAEKRLTGNKVLVANYTSTLDHLAVDLVIPSILVRNMLHVFGFYFSYFSEIIKTIFYE